MIRIPGLLLMLMIALTNDAWAREAAARLTIRVHDHAGIGDEEFQRAREAVNRIYGAIRVAVEWTTPPPLAPQAAANPGRRDVLDVLIIRSSMLTRRRLPENVLGFTSVPRGQRTRVAYIIRDRITRLAGDSSEAEAGVLMGAVMAHEIGHLLMPSRRHAREGIMRSHWRPTDLRRADEHDCPFDPFDQRAILASLHRQAGRGDVNFAHR